MAYVFRVRPELERVERAERVERVPGITPLTPGEIVRADLKKKIAEAWSTPEAQQLRDELSRMAKDYGEALRSLYKERGIADMIKSIAQRFRLGTRYKMAWGKE